MKRDDCSIPLTPATTQTDIATEIAIVSTAHPEPAYPSHSAPGSAPGSSPATAAARYRRHHPVTTE